MTPAVAKHPTQCPSCGKMHFSNPIPVVIVIQPVHLNRGGYGIVLVRKAIEPELGHFVLPGGFYEQCGDWRLCASDELRAEASVDVPVKAFAPLWFRNDNKKDLILLFSVANVIEESDLPPFDPKPNEEGVIETSERVIATNSREIRWPLHREAFDEVLYRVQRGRRTCMHQELFPLTE